MQLCRTWLCCEAHRKCAKNRPVSVQRTKSYSPDEDFLSPLTPNMLVTGCNGLGPPQEYLHEYDTDPRIRKSYLGDMECAWWYQYKVQCFDSLLPTRKWNTVKRNISVGDIVLIKYSSKTVPGTYRLGRITNTEFVKDGVVPTCTAKWWLEFKSSTQGDSCTSSETRINNSSWRTEFLKWKLCQERCLLECDWIFISDTFICELF